MANRETQLDELVAAVQISTHYRTIDRQLVECVGHEALSRYPSLKATIKATKRDDRCLYRTNLTV